MKSLSERLNALWRYFFVEGYFDQLEIFFRSYYELKYANRFPKSEYLYKTITILHSDGAEWSSYQISQ